MYVNSNASRIPPRPTRGLETPSIAPTVAKQASVDPSRRVSYTPNPPRTTAKSAHDVQKTLQDTQNHPKTSPKPFQDTRSHPKTPPKSPPKRSQDHPNTPKSLPQTPKTTPKPPRPPPGHLKKPPWPLQKPAKTAPCRALLFFSWTGRGFFGTERGGPFKKKTMLE